MVNFGQVWIKKLYPSIINIGRKFRKKALNETLEKCLCLLYEKLYTTTRLGEVRLG
jgi:hypothetical protein